jgi:hypothetical protein
LTALRHIGGAKIKGNPHSEFRSETLAVANLHGETALGPVQNGLPMKADEIDRRAIYGLRRQKTFDRFRMAIRDHGVGLCQGAGPRIAVPKGGRIP